MSLVRRRCCAQRRRLWPRRCTRRRPTVIWPLTVWPRQRWHFFGVALVSLPALHWRHCQHQAVLVAGVALVLLPSWPSKVRPVPRWRLLALHWHFASIALASSPASGCCPCCQHCAGVIALVAWALLPLLRWHHCPCCLRVAASITNWHLPSHKAVATGAWHYCQHRAILVAGVAPASLPSLRGRLCLCRADVAALSTPALPPALPTGIRPAMTQSQHDAGEASLSRSLSLPVASLLCPASAHSDLAFDGLAKAAIALFWRCTGVLARIALASLLASSCPCCRRCTGVVAKLAFEGPASTALAFAGVALAFCPHCAGVIASIVLLLSLLALHRRCRPQRMGIFALIARPSWWRSPIPRHCRMWHPCRIRCCLRPSSVFCRLTPLQQCTCLLPRRRHRSVSRQLPPS